MEPNPARVVQDTFKTLIANTAKPAPLNESDISLLHHWLSQVIVEHNQRYDLAQDQSVEEMIGLTTAQWAKDRKERIRKWRIAKDNNLFGAQLDPNGRLTAKQEETVDNFVLTHSNTDN